MVDLELSQKQGLTLAMQTSMRILQLNNMQLRDYIGEFMTNNAVVELEYPEIGYRPSPFDRQKGRTAQRTDGRETPSKEQLMEDKKAEDSALHDLFLQSAAMKLPSQSQRIMNYLIQSLDEKGFLTEPVPGIAQVLGVPAEAVQTCVSLLQSMEPTGVGATDVRDCLRLQLLRTAPKDEIAQRIVAAHLDDVAKQQYGAIAKALQIPKAQVIEVCERIRALNPKPLNGLSGDDVTPYILPDFYVVEEDGRLHCVMNDYFLPKIKIDPYYWDLIHKHSLSAADSEYIQRNYKQASELVKFLSYRKSTLQRVVEYVMQTQESFFQNGPGHRVPMSNQELAQALSLHESTVSRAVHGKYFECKWGVFPLRSLFMRSIRGRQEEDGNLDWTLQALQKIVESETPGTAYSDEQLAERLKDEGVSLARRTVAKYRKMLGIPTAAKRRAKPDGK